MLDYKGMRNQRELLDISQLELAEITGLSQNHISQIESGKKQPSLNSLGAIANALKIDPAALLNPTAPPRRVRGRPKGAPVAEGII